MNARTILGCVVLLVMSSALHAADAKVTALYDAYEKLNTPANLSTKFVGGRPLGFVQQQIATLAQLAALPAKDAADVTVKIVDEYLKRVDDLGAAKFRQSPLQSLQIPLAGLMQAHASSPEVMKRMERFAGSPVVKEYARSRVTALIVEAKLREIKPADDPDGTKRGRVLMDALIGEVTMSELLHAPTRLRALADQAERLGGGDPMKVLAALTPAAGTPERRYAAGYAFLLTTARRQVQEKKTLGDETKKTLLEVGGTWVNTWRPLVAREKYPSDLVGMTVQALAGYPGNDDLAALLKENGIPVTKYVEPKKPEVGDRPARENPPRKP